ncbi:MAG: YiiX/YebB-like N1pC/P60 family cysteine hydrolase [Pseudomonadota bacterium]
MSEPTPKTRKQASKARSRPPEAIGGIFIGRLDPAIDVAREVATALELDSKTVVTERTGTEILTALDTSADGSYATLLPFTVGQIAWRVEATIPHELVLPLALQGLAQRLKTRIAYDRHDTELDDRVDVYFPDGTMQEGFLHYHDEVEGLENYKFDMNVRPTILDKIGALIAGQITRQSSGYEPYTPSDPDSLLAALEPGDVLLVEGNQKVSAAIKYLTQSTWSHAAMYVGDALPHEGDSPRDRLIEVNLGEGCVARPLEKYATYNTRICRPVGLTDDEQQHVVNYMITRLGTAYDTRNILDMARYLFPVIPVPTRWRRKLIAFGSGDPTRAICSTLIAQAFQSIRYPILPSVKRLEDCLDDDCEAYAVGEVYHIRHHSLFAPRDFDVSPYFKIIKPTLSADFNFRDMIWHDSTGKDGEKVP